MMAARQATWCMASSKPPTFSDGSSPDQSFYELFFTTIDLTDFGYAPGASINGFDIRGANVPSSPDNAALDVVGVGILNVVPEPSAIWLLLIGAPGVFLFGKATRANHRRA